MTGRCRRAQGGFAMAALLAAMTIMAIFLSMALPAWRTASQREKETELIFRGQQYARAIVLFQRKYANTFPPNVDVLLNEHFLRRKYKDPMTESGEFQVIYANQQGSAQPSAGGTVATRGQPQQRPATTIAGGGTAGPQGGIIGVASKSTDKSIRVFNGRDKYNEWVFVAQQASAGISAPNGSQTPTGGVNVPGGAPGVGGRGQQFPGGRGGAGRGPGNQPPGPFGQPPGPRGGFGAPAGPGGGFGAPGGGRR
jgi:type II secretory pathway pseudopilin PulG